MFRIFFATAALFCAALPSATAETAKVPDRALIVTASDPSAVDRWEENRAVSRRMTDQLVLAITGQRDLKAAWRTLLTPQDKLGIKVSTAGGQYLSSHKGIIDSILAGAEAAGIPRAAVVLWDRDSALLRDAGFIQQRGGLQVRGIDPPSGLDPTAKFIAPMFGKLIWGDLMFRGKPAKLLSPAAQDDQFSAESHVATILTHDVTKVINVAVLCEDAGCGIAGAVYNITVPNVDNNRRFLQPGGASSLVDLYGDSRMGGKVVLNILDGLVAQYAGGPAFYPNYAFEHHTLYASKDAVALDATAMRLIEQWRREAKLPPAGKSAEWLGEAQVMGIGISSEDRITLQPVLNAP